MASWKRKENYNQYSELFCIAWGFRLAGGGRTWDSSPEKQLCRWDLKGAGNQWSSKFPGAPYGRNCGRGGSHQLCNCQRVKSRGQRCMCGSQWSNVSFGNQTQVENTQIHTSWTEQNAFLELGGQLEKDSKEKVQDKKLKGKRELLLKENGSIWQCAGIREWFKMSLFLLFVLNTSEWERLSF